MDREKVHAQNTSAINILTKPIINCTLHIELETAQHTVLKLFSELKSKLKGH